ncbi:hypothetical protein SELMODRAFT_417071 [Selaginella moellendorffii]|uniref:pyruvate decarboxylase n=1 Tax=Selaginella moellendorffii TaxID=88036 RepID=D8S198_SELML|nr:hypothetical protein SELMODRAFT_417071 [Selaginella moellendorffii]
MAEAWKKEGKVWVVAVKSELKALQWVLGDNRLHAKDTIYLVCIGHPHDPWVMNTFVRAKALCQSAKKELQLTIHYTARFEPMFGIEDLLNSEAKAVGADYLVSARSRRLLGSVDSQCIYASREPSPGVQRRKRDFLPKIVILSSVDLISSYSWSRNFHALVPKLVERELWYLEVGRILVSLWLLEELMNRPHVSDTCQVLRDLGFLPDSAEIGVTDLFGVPGDFNLLLLDELIAEPRLNFVGCCNELNAGYAADGYARAKGVGACVVTFTVGGLSVTNAIAGSYSENLPVICIVGGEWSNRVLHSTIGVADFTQELACFKPVTCAQLYGPDAVWLPKDGYFSRSTREHPPAFRDRQTRLSNQNSLHAAIDAAANFLNASAKPVLVAGPKLRVAKAREAFVELANSCEYATAVMPSAGDASTLHRDLLGSCELSMLLRGCRVGRRLSLCRADLQRLQLRGILTPDQEGEKLSWTLRASGESWRRKNSGAKLRVNVLFKHIQGMLSKGTAVISETGDSWFNCQKLKLPDGCGYEFQMQYGAIGCSVGALLGTDKVAAQDVGTMIRYGQMNIIFLINSSGDTIEVEIHDGAYNTIKNLDYTGVVNAFHNNDGKCWTAKVSTEALKTTCLVEKSI